MGQERPRKDKPPLEKLPEYPPFKGTDRSNLVIAHDRYLAQAMTYSQTAMSILVLGATIAAFLYLILKDVRWTIADIRVADIRAYICLLGVFPLFLISAARRTFLAWRHNLTAQFIEKELLGVLHTWEINPKIDDELAQFIKYEYDKKLTQRKKRRYYIFLHIIFTRFPFKYL